MIVRQHKLTWVISSIDSPQRRSHHSLYCRFFSSMLATFDKHLGAQSPIQAFTLNLDCFIRRTRVIFFFFLPLWLSFSLSLSLSQFYYHYRCSIILNLSFHLPSPFHFAPILFWTVFQCLNICCINAYITIPTILLLFGRSVPFFMVTFTTMNHEHLKKCECVCVCVCDEIKHLRYR